MDDRAPRTSTGRLVAVGTILVLIWSLIGYRLTVVQGARAEEFAERVASWRSKLAALGDGLLRRELFTAVPKAD